MKRFFNTNPFWSAFTKDKGSCSGSQAEALVDLVYPLLLKRSADPQGLVDYSLRLQRGELTALGLMQELMGSDFRDMDVEKIDTRVPRVSKPSNYNKLNLYHHQYYVESSDRTVIVPLNFFDCILISL